MIRRTLNLFRTDGPASIARRVARHLAGRSRAAAHDEVASIYRLLRRRRASDSVMVDVGSHFGESLRPFALDGWAVHSFEPDAENRALLQRKYGALPNVRIDPRGVSNEARSAVPFYRSDVSSGISGLSRFHESHVEAGAIELTTLREYFAAHGIARIDFLKIDTEGFDYFVLQGLPWETHQPEVIISEFEDSKTRPLGYTFVEMADYLAQRGYKVLVSEWYPIERYGIAHRWRRLQEYPAQLADERAWGNLVAFRHADHAERFTSCFLPRTAGSK